MGDIHTPNIQFSKVVGDEARSIRSSGVNTAIERVSEQPARAQRHAGKKPKSRMSLPPSLALLATADKSRMQAPCSP
jgi:hypothetical protein